MKTDLPYGVVADSSTRVRCVFCGVCVPKSNKCIEEHTNGAKHKENIELAEEQGITFNDDDHLYCKLCKTVLNDDESVSKHIEEDDHANWIASVEDLVDGEFILLEAYLSSDKDKEDITCGACQTIFPCTLQNIEDHVNSFNHRANVVDKLKPLNGIFNVENNEEVWCKICNEYIDNTVESIFDHIDNEDKHLDWLADVESLIADNDISVENYLTQEFEDNAYCNKCNVQIQCYIPIIEDHINSETHLNNFS